MKKIIHRIVVVLTVCFSFSAFANENLKTFNVGNEAYKAGEFSKALKSYKTVESNQEISAELFYNLGNTYFRLDKIGWSVLYYEKALKENPNLEDATINLEKVKKKTIDKIEKLPVPGIVRIYKNFLNILNAEAWSMVSLSCIVLFLLGVILLNFSNKSVSKKTFFILNSLLVSLGVISLVFALSSSYYQKDEMVLVTDNVYVKSEPTSTGTDLFILHEGAKVELKKINKLWIQIKLSDGLVGWVKKDSFEHI